jgi:hypothetical protein
MKITDMLMNDDVRFKNVVKFDNWVMPPEKDLKNVGFSTKDLDRAKIIVIPKSYFLKDDFFEPFTMKDINETKDNRIRKIANGFLNNDKMPYLIATTFEKEGKPPYIEVLDGFTRAGICIPLKIKEIKAILL